MFSGRDGTRDSATGEREERLAFWWMTKAHHATRLLLRDWRQRASWWWTWARWKADHGGHRGLRRGDGDEVKMELRVEEESDRVLKLCCH